jgi:hypothetical protein
MWDLKILKMRVESIFTEIHASRHFYMACRGDCLVHCGVPVALSSFGNHILEAKLLNIRLLFGAPPRKKHAIAELGLNNCGKFYHSIFSIALKYKSN